MKIIKILFSCLNIFLILVILFSLSNILRFANVNTDAGYFLSLSRRISEGWIPLKDIYTSYPLVGVYLFAFVQKLFGAKYEINLAFLFFIYLAISILVYRISFSLIKTKSLRILSAILTYFFTLVCQGYGVFLEPFVILFSLLTLFLILKGEENNFSYFLSGASAGLAIFSKQYGLAIFPIAFILIFLKYQKPLSSFLKKALYFSLGTVLVLSLVFFYFTLIHKVPLSKFLDIYQNKEYVLRFTLSQKMHTFIKYLHPLKLGSLFILTVLPIRNFFLNRANKNNNLLFILYACFIVFLLPMFIGYPFLHYFQLIVPFFILIGVYYLELTYQNFTKKKDAGSFFLLTFAAFLIFLSIISGAVSGSLWIRGNGEKKLAQKILAAKINEIILEKSEVLIFNKPEYFYLCNFLPPERQLVGYGFATVNYKKGKWMEALDRVKIVLVFEGKDIPGSEAKKVIESKNFKLNHIVTHQGKTVEIWKI